MSGAPGDYRNYRTGLLKLQTAESDCETAGLRIRTANCGSGLTGLETTKLA